MNKEIARKRKAEGWIVVSLWLEPQLSKSFQTVKVKKGLKHDTEVLRMAITEFLNREGVNL